MSRLADDLDAAIAEAVKGLRGRAVHEVLDRRRVTARPASVTSYDDGRVACTDQEIIIRHYYFVGAKHVKYSAIREVHRVPFGEEEQTAYYGSDDLIHWFNFHPRRPRKDTALVIYLASRTRPVITPDDPDRVNAELAAHGVNVTIGREAELH